LMLPSLPTHGRSLRIPPYRKNGAPDNSFTENIFLDTFYGVFCYFVGIPMIISCVGLHMLMETASSIKFSASIIWVVVSDRTPSCGDTTFNSV
jgi:hypothetical protein